MPQPGRNYLIPTPALVKLMRRQDDCRRQFREFVRHAWPVIDTRPLVWGKHIEAICDHLQAVTEGHIKKLLINIPPGHAKSALTSVLWPAWEWIDRPQTQSLFGSYDIRLALRDSVKCRTVFLSDWYQELFRPKWKMKKDSNAMGFYTNTLNGNRYTFGMKAGGRTGWRGDKVVIDDPVSVDDQWNPKVKEECYHRYNNTLSTRVNDLSKAVFVVMGQRVADDDLFGRILGEKDCNYDLFKLPSFFNPEKRCRTSIGWTDWRKEKDELLFEEMFPRVQLEYLREYQLGEVGFATQYQQEPTSEEGTRFKKSFFRWYEERDGLYLLHRKDGRDEPVIPQNCWTFVSVDVAASEKTYADFTVFGLWAVTHKYDMILLDIQMGQWDQPTAVNRAVDMYKQSGFGNRRHHTAFVVEANGVGLPMIQTMQQRGLPVVPVNVSQDKIAMSATAVLRLEAGSIFFPFAETKELKVKYPFMESFLKELTNFPGAAHDDQVTMISLAAEGVFKTGVAGLGGAKTLEALERPAQRTAAETVQFTPAQPRRALFGEGGRNGHGNGTVGSGMNGTNGRNGFH